MKIQVVILVSMISGAVNSPLNAQEENFEGIIKYALYHSNGIDVDTLVCYFGKQKIRAQRIGRLADRYGVSDIIDDYRDNTTTIHSSRNDPPTVIAHTPTLTKVTDYPDSVRMHMGMKCTKSSATHPATSYMGYSFQATDYAWSTSKLIYKTSPTSPMKQAAFSNQAGEITLISERMVKTDLTEYNLLNSGGMSKTVAFDIRYERLPEEVFLIK